MSPLLLCLAVAATAVQPCEQDVERVSLPAAAFFVDPYLGKPIELCGLVEEGAAHKGERILFALSDLGDPNRFLVHDPERRLPLGQTACMRGVVRKRVEAAEPSASAIATPVQNPDFVLYPLECGSDQGLSAARGDAHEF